MLLLQPYFNCAVDQICSNSGQSRGHFFLSPSLRPVSWNNCAACWPKIKLLVHWFRAASHKMAAEDAAPLQPEWTCVWSHRPSVLPSLCSELLGFILRWSYHSCCVCGDSLSRPLSTLLFPSLAPGPGKTPCLLP